MTAVNDARLLCAFSPGGGAALAIATPDGRVRVFDTSSGKLRATLGAAASAGAGNHVLSLTSGHLTEFHTCLAWVAAKGKKKASGGAASLLVLGLANGDVKCFDAQLCEEKWRSVNAIEGGVLAVVCSPAGMVYATGRSCQIVALEAATGSVTSKFSASKYAISSLALSPDQQHLLGGGSSMQLWGVQAEERQAKFTGHPVDVRCTAFAPNGTHAVSAGSGERHVAVWDVHSARKRPKKQHAAVASLSVEDPVVQLDTYLSNSSSTVGSAVNGSASEANEQEQDVSFCVAAVSEAGEAYVWRVATCSSSGSSSVDVQLLARVRVGAEPARGAAAGKDEAILAAVLVPGQQGPSLLVARGTSARPAFERVPIPASGVSTEATEATSTSQADATAIISLQPSGGALLSSNGPQHAQAVTDKSVARQKAAGTAHDKITVLGPDNLGHAVLLRTAAGGAANTPSISAGKKRAAPADDLEPSSAVSTDGLVTGFEDEEEVPDLPEGEESLMDRLAALEGSAADDRPGATAGDQQQGTSEAELANTDGAGHSNRAVGGSGGTGTADSLSVLLTQALRSGDRTLLERCFSSSSSTAVINNTIARIAPQDALLFLRAAVDRLMSKPARAAALASWLRALLHHHTGYLMTAPGAQAPLTALFQAIDARVRLHEPLLKVFGRLNLLSHHSAAVVKAGGGGIDGRASGSSLRPPPEVVYNDHLDEDEEPTAEDAFNPAAVSDDEDDGSDDGEGGSEGSSDGDDGLDDAAMDEDDGDDFDDDDL